MSFAGGVGAILLDVLCDKVQEVPSRRIYAHIQAKLSGARPRQCYLDAWIRVAGLYIVEKLERELGAPLVYAVTAREWANQKRLRVRKPITAAGVIRTLL